MTQKVGDEITRYFMTQESANLNAIFTVAGRNNAGSGQNVGMSVAELKHWDERQGETNSAQAIIARANQYFNQTSQNAAISIVSPPTVRGLGQSSGFELWLQDISDRGYHSLNQAQTMLLTAARENQNLNAVRVNSLAAKALLQVDIDRQKHKLTALNRRISTKLFLLHGEGFMLMTLLTVAE